MPQRTLIVMPTYNESENLAEMVGRIRLATPFADILIVDDDSPDGTGAIADDLAAGDEHVSVIHRTGKLGLGTAYVAGFRRGLEQGYEVLCEIDADGSHAPEQLPDVLDGLTHPDRADLSIGSRWVPGGRVLDWPWHREVLSKAGNLYTRVMLGLRVRDATAGFRAYRADVLRLIDLDSVASEGYCFQIDLAWRVRRVGGRVREVPIAFRERRRGSSKMDNRIVREALWRVTTWGVRRMFGRLRPLANGQVLPNVPNG